MWGLLSDSQQRGVITLAKEVIASPSVSKDLPLPNREDFPTETYLVSAAVALLAEVGQFDPAIIPDEVLVSVTTALLLLDRSEVDEISRARDDLRDSAWQRCRDELVERLAGVARSQEHAATLLLHLLPKWDSRLTQPFIESARHPEAHQGGGGVSKRELILETLMDRGEEAAIQEALDELVPLASSLPVKEEKIKASIEDRLVYRGAVTFEYAPTRVWELLEDRFDDDESFATRWLQALANRFYDRRKEWPDIPAALTGRLYRRLHRLFPGLGDSIKELRWKLIGSLVSRASRQDITELETLHAELPDAGLERTVANAKKQHRLLNPQYPSPEEVLRMATDPTRLPIRSDAELQHAVVAAFGIVQDQIAHREQRDASIFWSPAGKNKDAGLRPRDENYISDRIVAMLLGILGSRGVTVTRESEANRYDRTDILVQAPPDIAKGRSELASVAVEVKGSWHKEVLTAMQSQLADRYLNGMGRKHGIFLVVWFEPEHWSDTDTSRKRASKQNTPDQLEAKLVEQANVLKGEGYEIEPIVLRIPPSW